MYRRSSGPVGRKELRKRRPYDVRAEKPWPLLPRPIYERRMDADCGRFSETCSGVKIWRRKDPN